MAIVGGNKLKDILKEIKEKASKTTLKVGVLEGATNSKGDSIPQYAAELTFGRWPFMQRTVQQHGKEWSNQVAHSITNLNWEFENALTVVGDIASKDMQDNIQTYPKSPPNSEATIERKKALGYNPFDQPLVESGDMLRAISFEVDSGD